MPVTNHENPLNPPCRGKVRHAAKADFPLGHTVTGTTNSSKIQKKEQGCSEKPQCQNSNVELVGIKSSTNTFEPWKLDTRFTTSEKNLLERVNRIDSQLV